VKMPAIAKSPKAMPQRRGALPDKRSQKPKPDALTPAALRSLTGLMKPSNENECRAMVRGLVQVSAIPSWRVASLQASILPLWA
jgi:hypothetical protein